ncbi:annexin D2-like [Phalaenopsis equestris]|uniref:annexin D2-like n=1 Tax=Phalaenopsis equestris TaxID=78828 RepID=UPI0009E4D49E|nr:annexin D2-like [Phalaenopsis equestris]
MEGEWRSSDFFNKDSRFMVPHPHRSSNLGIHEPSDFYPGTYYTDYFKNLSGYNCFVDLRDVEINGYRNAEELSPIRPSLPDLYNQDALYILSQKNDYYSHMVYLQLSEPSDRDAEIIRRAMYGYSTDLILVMEIVCTRSSLELLSIKQAYRMTYISLLEHDFATRANGSLKEILSAILNSRIYAGERFDTRRAMCDAKILYEAVTSCKFIDQKSIISILSKRNVDEMRVILSSFKHLFGQEFIKFLKNNYKCDEFGIQLRAVIRCIQSPEKHFAKQLRTAMETGDAPEVLIRTVVTRTGIDIKEIDGAFSVKTGMSLESLIKKEFNCSYESSLGWVCDGLISLLKNSKRKTVAVTILGFHET